jgi:hypothetical protein
LSSTSTCPSSVISNPVTEPALTPPMSTTDPLTSWPALMKRAVTV